MRICFAVIPGKVVNQPLSSALIQDDGAGELRELCRKATRFSTVSVGYRLLQLCVIGVGGELVEMAEFALCGMAWSGTHFGFGSSKSISQSVVIGHRFPVSTTSLL